MGEDIRVDDDGAFVDENSWMVRPCSLYKEEYKDCKSVKSRFHQHFVYGSFIDCSQWMRDFDNCVRWTESNNLKAFKEIIESESLRRYERLTAHRENDVWEKRREPPADWNEPLPKWMEDKLQNSYLAIKAKDIKNQLSTERTFCVIL